MSESGRRFVHLHVHSEYSFHRSINRIRGLVDLAKTHGMHAVGLTDYCNLHGAWKFNSTALRAGIKPIIGCELLIDAASYPKVPRPNGAPFHLTLIARTREGFSNLVKLLSVADRHAGTPLPTVPMNQIARHHNGLIALSGCLDGVVPQLIIMQRIQEVFGVVTEMRQILGENDYYFEVHPPLVSTQKWVNSVLFDLGEQLSIPTVACCDVRYPKSADRAMYETMLKLAQVTGDSKYNGAAAEENAACFLPAAEISTLFKAHPEALDMTIRIADRCEASVLPDSTRRWWQGSSMDTPDCPRRLRDKLTSRAAALGLDPGQVRIRIESELSFFEEIQGTRYLCFLSEMVDAIKAEGCIVGPGRGRAAGSMLSYLLGISAIDPIQFNLPSSHLIDRSERGFSAGQPDIQVITCERGFKHALGWIRNTLGGTLIHPTIFARPRAMDLVQRLLMLQSLSEDNLGIINDFYRQFPGQSLGALQGQAHGLLKHLRESGELLDFLVTAEAMENLPVHALAASSAFFVLPESMPAIPIFNDIHNQKIAQWTLNDIKEAGYLGFELMPVWALDLVSSVLDSIHQSTGTRVSPAALIDFNDQATYAMLHGAGTLGVHLLHRKSARQLLADRHPHDLDQLAVVLAFSQRDCLQPGGDHAPTPPLPDRLREILDPTSGVLLFEEQALDIVHHLTGQDHEMIRERLRNLVKNPSDIRSFQDQLLRAAGRIGWQPESIRSLIEAVFAWQNLHSRPHLLSTAALSFWTAFLKCHYPGHFLLTLLTHWMGPDRPLPGFRYDLVRQVIAECRQFNLSVTGDARWARYVKLHGDTIVFS
ncbi:PHP domain-containing protein [bacterium]|nr:PHP domain-containing protein [candidate division CSSED10-310 bacterium]